MKYIRLCTTSSSEINNHVSELEFVLASGLRMLVRYRYGRRIFVCHKSVELRHGANYDCVSEISYRTAN